MLPCSVVYVGTDRLVSKWCSKKSKRNIKMMLKLIPTLPNNQFGEHPKNDAENTSKDIVESMLKTKLGLPFCTNCLALFRSGAIGGDLFVRNIWRGHPWTEFDLPWASTGPTFLTFWKISNEMQICSKCQRFQSSISILRKQMASTIHLQKKQEIVQKICS